MKIKAKIPGKRNNPIRLDNNIRVILFHAVKKFFAINGFQWGEAFAFNAFFSLFPLMILLVSVISFFIDRNSAGRTVIIYIEGYVPINAEMKGYIFDTIDGVIKAREEAGLIALVVLIWVTIQCFTTLIYAANRAWSLDTVNRLRVLLKSLLFLVITLSSVIMGVFMPMLLKVIMDTIFPRYDFQSWIYELGGFFFPLVIVFFCLSSFYRFAPYRITQMNEVWFASFLVTILLRLGESLFIVYLKNFTSLNVLYGAFGGIMALLLWIYLSGCLFIFGGCICAAQAQLNSRQ